ncbi:hypothetical protein [Peribacillus simplex]|uniref:Uncharacterized protein n=1 Tax=Peribacillus simplex TaxID=1478 RepID=A0AAN2PF90_9BACI|nr:hypothetical protein [Peribacillus simplex]CEG31458.1 hypothetical protein BN1180_01602 [Peribacillus simplex]
MDDRMIKLFQMEIKNQCQFALLSIESINKLMMPPLATFDSNEVWFYIQSFLNSTANVSKLLFGTKDRVSAARKTLRDSLNVSDDSVIKIRDMRNHFEHFDERIEKWNKTSVRHNFADKLIGPTNMIQGLDQKDYFRHFDTTKGAITFNGEEYLIQPIVDELVKIHTVTSKLEFQKVYQP